MHRILKFREERQLVTLCIHIVRRSQSEVYAKIMATFRCRLSTEILTCSRVTLPACNGERLPTEIWKPFETQLPNYGDLGQA